MPITFNPLSFRQVFPAFCDATAYPDARLSAYFSLASGYVSPEDYGSLAGEARTHAINLMVAHLLATTDAALAGQSGTVIASRVGDVQVQLQPPPERGQWRYWLNQTPYGAQLLALLEMQSAGGFYVGGLPERSAFRKVGGVF